jgi:hypothetical protein
VFEVTESASTATGDLRSIVTVRTQCVAVHWAGRAGGAPLTDNNFAVIDGGDGGCGCCCCCCCCWLLPDRGGTVHPRVSVGRTRRPDHRQCCDVCTYCPPPHPSGSRAPVSFPWRQDSSTHRPQHTATG